MTENVELQQPIGKQQTMDFEKQGNEAESQKEEFKHQEDNVEHTQHELEPSQDRDNELEIIFQDEPIEEQRSKDIFLEKYVTRHHVPKKIIAEKEFGVMKRKILRSDTCLLYDFEHKSMKGTLENESWIQEMNG